jgi:hypothetical protein
MPKIADNSFEDCEKIFVVKVKEEIAVYCRCLELGEDCSNSILCCSGYCNSSSQKCEELSICPQDRICSGALEASKDALGRDCCPSHKPVCSNQHCCPVDKPKWCENPISNDPNDRKCMSEDEYKTGCIAQCEEKRGEEGCLGSDSVLPPYNFCPISPYDEIGVYCSGKVKEIVDNCISSFNSKLDRVKCIVGWSYSHFDSIVYDFSYKCWCIGRKGLNPNDVISCAQTQIFPAGCGGCGVCVDFATTLYSLLMTCGQDCDVSTDNLYLVNGCLSRRGMCTGCHAWLLYKHPTTGWVFVDPTITSLMGSVDGYFSSIINYPCIMFSIDNLDKNCMWETPDGLVRSDMCPGWGIDLSTCPT